VALVLLICNSSFLETGTEYLKREGHTKRGLSDVNVTVWREVVVTPVSQKVIWRFSWSLSASRFLKPFCLWSGSPLEPKKLRTFLNVLNF